MSQVGRTADITGDGHVNEDDLLAMAEVWLLTSVDPGFEPDADLNYDEKINNTDSDILSANWLSDAQLSEIHFYYHYDGLGSVIALSDSVGRVVEKYQYAVYGNPRILNQNNKQLTESKYGNPYMFTGRRFDTETSLYYYRARYYSTEIGRFLQVDAIGYEDSMNLYIYVGNNPIVLVDPSGLCQESRTWDGTEWLPWFSPEAVFRELGDSSRENWLALQYYADNAKRTIQHQFRVDSIGIDTNAGLVLPFFSGGSGVVGGLNKMWGGDAEGRYSYSSLGRGNTGVDIGIAGQIVLAQGSGDWQGEFDAVTINVWIFTASTFSSPNRNWKGVTFGVSWGLPAGIAKERTTYSPLVYNFER